MNASQSKRKQIRDPRLIEGVVSGTLLFRGASPAQVAGVARHCWTLQARRGDLVAARDSRLAGVFALAYGTVKLALRGPADEERVLRLVSAGQSFGESTALLARPCRYEARALVECKLVIIPPAAIFGLIDGDPRSARQVVQALAERSFELLSEVESFSLQSGAQRLASYLASLAEPARGSGAVDGACTVRLPAAKTVIASRLGMKKETLSRLLRSLSDRGLIQVTQRDITILDRERLAGLS
jgi:CRP-like cAMP-binding protein